LTSAIIWVIGLAILARLIWLTFSLVRRQRRSDNQPEFGPRQPAYKSFTGFQWITFVVGQTLLVGISVYSIAIGVWIMAFWLVISAGWIYVMFFAKERPRR